MSEDKTKFRYVQKEGGIGLGLLNKTDQGVGATPGLGNLKAQFQGQIDSFGNRLEQRVVKIRTRFQSIGLGFGNGVQPQEQEKTKFYCPSCNAEVGEKQNFCGSCSISLNSEGAKLAKAKNDLRISSHMAVILDS